MRKTGVIYNCREEIYSTDLDRTHLKRPVMQEFYIWSLSEMQ